MQVSYVDTVELKSTPGYSITGGGPTAVGAMQTGDAQLLIDFGAPVDADEQLHIPANDPGVRTLSGGYVTAADLEISE